MSIWLAFTLGLFSSAHCIGMCGSIIGALGFALPVEVRQNRLRLLGYTLGYSAGRIASYTAAGLLLGGLVGTGAQALGPAGGHRWLAVLASLALVALGLHLGGWLPPLLRLEDLGLRLWRGLRQLARPLLPVRAFWQTLAFGMIWGWLPCGLVYTTLAWAATAGSAADSGLRMLMFGLGTVPAVTAAGLFTGLGGRLFSARRTRQALGLLLIAFALYTLVVAFAMPAHHHELPMPDGSHAGMNHSSMDHSAHP